MLVEILKGMIGSVNLALPESKREAIGDRYEEIDKMKPIMQEAVRQEIILTSFYTYRNISDEELSAYTRFYEAELGQKEIRITGAALSDVLKHWFDDFEKTMISAVQEAEKGKE
jgi:hypothetical protein